MKPTPWASEATEPGERQVAEALAASRFEPPPRSPRQEREMLEAIQARSGAPSGAQPRHLLYAAAAIAAVALAILARRPAAPQLGTPGLEASADADYHLAPAAPGGTPALKVTRGRLTVRFPARSPVELDAPGLRGHIDAQQFEVQVAGTSCTLAVWEGTAEILAIDGRVVRVASGQSIQSSDPRLQAPAPAPSPRPTAAAHSSSPVGQACSALGALETRRACYQAEARGDDLAAQNAILELGMLEQEQAHDGQAALEAWRGYRQRFPAGPLGPEASVAILGELLAEHRLPEARREAEGFLAQYPDDGRVGEVGLARADLACQAGEAEALAAFDRLQSGAGIDRADLLLRRGNCESLLGRRDAARAHWRQALQSAPSGPHAEELRRRLAD